MTFSNPGAIILQSNSLAKMAGEATSAVVPATWCKALDDAVSMRQAMAALVRSAFGGARASIVTRLVEAIELHSARSETTSANEAGRALQRAQIGGVAPSTVANNLPRPVVDFLDANAPALFIALQMAEGQFFAGVWRSQSSRPSVP